MQTKDWDSILEKLIKQPDFVSQINQRGYYLSPKGISFATIAKRTRANPYKKYSWISVDQLLA